MSVESSLGLDWLGKQLVRSAMTTGLCGCEDNIIMVYPRDWNELTCPTPPWTRCILAGWARRHSDRSPHGPPVRRNRALRRTYESHPQTLRRTDRADFPVPTSPRIRATPDQARKCALSGRSCTSPHSRPRALPDCGRLCGCCASWRRASDADSRSVPPCIAPLRGCAPPS